MIKYLLFIGITIIACSPPKNSTRIVTRTVTSTTTTVDPADTVIYVKSPLEFEQKDYLPQLLGRWNIVSMQRQTKLPAENIPDLSFSLGNSGKFEANTSCGAISGSYSVKGVSIKFNQLASALNNCSNQSQLNEMIRLLETTVSMYTVEGNEVTFRDNSSNIIFKGNRR